MFLLPRAASQAQSPRRWALLSILPPLGMLMVSGLLLVDLRRDAWQSAQTQASNLLRVIEADLDRNIELYDLSLQAVVDNLKVPGVDDMPPEVRQLVLFNRAATAKDLGALVVVDAVGNTILDASHWPARRANYADRPYFQAHRADADLNLHISGPVTSRLTGAPVYNDCYRHHVGDAVLQGLARCLEASVKRLGDRVCRIGGEEFAILLPNTTEIVAVLVAEQVHAAVATLDIPSAEARGGSITVSVGLASAGPGSMPHREPGDLFHFADEALYAAKAAGRNRTEVAVIPGQVVAQGSTNLPLVDGPPMAA